MRNTGYTSRDTCKVSKKLNLLYLRPDYPREPRTLGERIRNRRMNLGLKVRELAKMFRVTEDAVINWELRNVSPDKKNKEKIRNFLDIKKV